MDLSNGGSSNWTSILSRRTKRLSTASIAIRERSASPARERTDQLCGNRIDLTFGIGRRSERGTVVEVRAPVPFTVPSVLLDILSKLRRFVQATFREQGAATHMCDIREPQEHFVKKETQPDAFAFAVFTHEVHAVVPVTGAHERKTMFTKSKSTQDGAHTMIVERRGGLGTNRQIVVRVFVRLYVAAFDEMDRFIQNAGIPRRGDVAADGPGQPEIIIGATRADATPRRWMPPVLNVTFTKLMRLRIGANVRARGGALNR